MMVIVALAKSIRTSRMWFALKIQTCGRAARNVGGMVIMYADEITGSMQRTIDETERRRTLQEQFNREHGVVPQTVNSPVKDTLRRYLKDVGYQFKDEEAVPIVAEIEQQYGSVAELEKAIKKLEKEMHAAARELAFEHAAELRDRIKAMRRLEIELG